MSLSGILPPVSAMVLPPVSVTVPPLQLPTRLGGVANPTSAGSVSLNATPVAAAGFANGFVIVKVSVDVPPA